MASQSNDVGKPIPSREITPEKAYLNRRSFLKATGVAATALATGYTYRKFNTLPPVTQQGRTLAGLQTGAATSQPGEKPVDPSIAKAFHVDEPQTSFQSITHYNNYYEFSTDKDGVANEVGKFKTDGWKITIDGLCSKPATLDLDDIMKVAPPEERVYRMRCVEAWSMVIPWAGYSLSRLLDRVQPTSAAKYVAFTTIFAPQMMPNQSRDVLPWPYVEGLRMDEAMHPLTLLTTGLYGRELPVADGAPVRLITPWKYGFKGIKAIVKISLVADMPPTTWNKIGSSEYGFYANVNPQVDHPRWSQATENRIDVGRRPTLMFNGYAEQVASLYSGMDLRKYY